jgi:hypothetical protein
MEARQLVVKCFEERSPVGSWVILSIRLSHSALAFAGVAQYCIQPHWLRLHLLYNYTGNKKDSGAFWNQADIALVNEVVTLFVQSPNRPTTPLKRRI